MIYRSDAQVTLNKVFLIWHPDFQGAGKLKEINANIVSVLHYLSFQGDSLGWSHHTLYHKV